MNDIKARLYTYLSIHLSDFTNITSVSTFNNSEIALQDIEKIKQFGKAAIAIGDYEIENNFVTSAHTRFIHNLELIVFQKRANSTDLSSDLQIFINLFTNYDFGLLSHCSTTVESISAISHLENIDYFSIRLTVVEICMNNQTESYEIYEGNWRKNSSGNLYYITESDGGLSGLWEYPSNIFGYTGSNKYFEKYWKINKNQNLTIITY